MELTISHWMYGFFTLMIIVTMIARRGVVFPALLGTFVVTWVFKGNIIDGFTAIFHANLVAAQELFNIFLIITFMLALLHSLRDLGADKKMIQPIQKVMVNGHVSFFVLIAATYVISLFFWPTPAVPLICALLVPAAARSGLPVMLSAVAIAIAGQGMALSSDYMVRVAPNISATSAGVETAAVADQALILSLVTGVIAIGCVYLFYGRSIRSKDDPRNEEDLKKVQPPAETDKISPSRNLSKWSKLFAVLVPLTMLVVVLYMMSEKLMSGRMTALTSGNETAFIGGVAVILLLLSTLAFGRQHALDYISTHITNGFVFAFKAMGPVIPIAGFFYMGSADFSGSIIGVEENPPALLFDLVQSSQEFLPQSAILAAFSVLIIGIITGLDGSGFSGLPLTGALAASLQNGSIDTETLAAIGQMGSIWTGGGTIVAWSSLIAIAGFCGVSVMDLVRKNFFPVMLGLFVSTLIAVFFL
ncbi:hypothetical protein [Lentibacillus sediminis]|uniref:hypothetical protein n=1 Tax=Lentibacillus sediminis TaxID=1940529 RepID=UPI000C1BAF92|nr:hypothetical protein [Lentibacillus sediminis]